jgi:DNA mismatch repair protein Mlh1 C-terminus
MHKSLVAMLKRASYVGMVDAHLSLLQFQTKLVLVNHYELAKEVSALCILPLPLLTMLLAL